jgi:hypothetical protein
MPLPAGNSRIDFHSLTITGDMIHSMFFSGNEESHHIVFRGGPQPVIVASLQGEDFSPRLHQLIFSNLPLPGARQPPAEMGLADPCRKEKFTDSQGIEYRHEVLHRMGNTAIPFMEPGCQQKAPEYLWCRPY